MIRQSLRVLSTAAAILFISGTVIYFASPALLSRGLSEWAKNQGYDRIEHGELHISFSEGISLSDLRLVRGNETALKVEQVDISISMTALLRGQLHIDLVRLSGAKLQVQRDEEGTVVVSGLTIGNGNNSGNKYVIDLLQVVNGEVLLQLPHLEGLVTVNNLRIDGGGHIAIERMQLKDLQADITRTATESWRVSWADRASKGMFETNVRDNGGRNSSPLSSDFSLQIGTIEVIGDSKIRYQDTLLDVAVEGTMLIDEAWISGLDTRTPEQALTFLLREYNPTGVNSIWQGTAYPFGKQPKLSLKAQIESVSLPLISKIAAKKFGLQINRGKALVNLKVDLTDNKVDGTLGLQLTEFQVQEDGEDVVGGRKLEIRMTLAELLHGRLRIKEADLDGVRLKVEHLENGTNRIVGQIFDGGQSTRSTNRLEALHITDGQLEFTGPAMQFTAHVNKLQLNGTHIDTDIISFQDLKIGIIRTSHNDWQFTAKSDETSVTYGFGSKGYDHKAGENPLQGIILKANRIEFTGDSTFRFEDRSSALPLVRTMRFNRAWMTNINSGTPESFSSLVLSMQSDQYGRFDLEGTVKLFTSPPELLLNGHAEAIRLTPLSPITDQRFGFDIETGQFDADIEIAISEHKIDGRVDLQINLLTVSPTDKDKIEAFEDSLYEGLKLQQIINLLTDKHGRMVIGLPVKGDPRAPTFDLDINMESAINRAITEVTKIVIAPILTAIFRKTKTNSRHIAALPFAIGEHTLNKKAYRKLERAVEKLTTHPERLVAICGSASKNEITNSTATDEKKLNAALLALADRRTNLVRKLLIEEYGIAARRLIDCRAEIKSSLKHLHVDIR